MNSTTILEDLFRHSDWAIQKIFRMCDALDEPTLDAPASIGFGSLRNILFHILAAEEIWMERWCGAPPRPLPTSAEGLPLSAIEDRAAALSQQRFHLLAAERDSDWQRIVNYVDSKGNPYHNRLKDLLVHVANHGIHHRAQILYLLKQQQKRVAGGLDYLFYRFAHPAFPQTSETQSWMKQHGMEVGTSPGSWLDWDLPLVQRYYRYSDWANGKVLAWASTMDDALLDQPQGIGMGTLRKNLLHIQDAERWWLNNWTIGPTDFSRASDTTPIKDILEDWTAIQRRRDAEIATWDTTSAQRIVQTKIAGHAIAMPAADSAVQLLGHGTHHRAQILHCLKRCGVAVSNVDFLFWLRDPACVDPFA